ncbi:MAG TPA: hypothetical protein VMW87_06365 [Spirochaetia bacterium]|nr:hypothetical protein [Spirochaetia bacterium]
MSARDPIKVYDARWENGEFDSKEVYRLFEAALIYGRSLGAKNVTITRDARLGAATVMELAMKAALDGGFRTFACVDPVSTPQSYYLAHRTTERYGATMGLSVTASHNPGRDIGAKFTVPAVRAVGLDCGPEGGLSRVRQIYHGSERLSPSRVGTLQVVDVTAEYVDYSLRVADVADGELSGMRVVLDAMNGAAGGEIYQALDRAGAVVQPMHLLPDGNFPRGAPNPTSQGKMDDAVAAAARFVPPGEASSPIVVGLDGDGDRLVFGDSRGILSAGFSAVAILCGERFTVTDGGSVPVLFDPKVNPVSLEMWGRFPVAPVLFRNGHSQIKEYMHQIGASFAAEESGHYYHRLDLGGLQINAENSIVTALRFLGAVKSNETLLDEMWAGESRIYSTGELNYRLESDEAVDAAMIALVAEYRADGATSTSATVDGIELGGTQVNRGVDLTPGRVGLHRGWYSGYLRASTNERAVIRAFFTSGEETVGRAVSMRAVETLEKRFGATRIE